MRKQQVTQKLDAFYLPDKILVTQQYLSSLISDREYASIYETNIPKHKHFPIFNKVEAIHER
jgi:hypothetical protein